MIDSSCLLHPHQKSKRSRQEEKQSVFRTGKKIFLYLTYALVIKLIE
jgi:hypothetical protein